MRTLGERIVDRPEPAAGGSLGRGPRGATNSGGVIGGVANEAGLSSLGEEMDRSSRGRSSRRRPTTRSPRRRRVRRGALIGLAVLLVLVGGGGGYLYYLTHDLNRVNVRGLNSAFKTGQETGTENILMVGSTSRCALKVQNAAYGLCSQGVKQ